MVQQNKQTDSTKGLLMKHHSLSLHPIFIPQRQPSFIIIGVTRKTLNNVDIPLVFILPTLDSMCSLYMKDRLNSLILPPLLFFSYQFLINYF